MRAVLPHADASSMLMLHALWSPAVLLGFKGEQDPIDSILTVGCSS